MIAICVEYREKNFVTDYMMDGNFLSLPIFNKTLVEVQLENFINFDFEKIIFFCDSDYTSFPSVDKKGMFDISFMDREALLLYLLSRPKAEKVLVFKSNVYFETDKLPEHYDLESDFSEFVFSTDNVKDTAICLLTSVNNILKKITILKKPIEILKGCPTEKSVKTSYFKVLDTHIDYKELMFDIFSSKTSFKPPIVAEGVFTQGKLPRGDFTIIPPVFFGEGVQIESGAVIGPNVVLLDNSLIAKNTHVRNSVLFNDVYISSGCFIDGAVCLSNATVKRNGAVFNDVLLGQNVVVGEDVMVEGASRIKPEVKIEKHYKLPFYEDADFFGLKNLFPDKAALLGAALGEVYGSPAIGVGSDGTPNALAVKLALISGLIASGADCTDFGVIYNSRLFYNAAFCELKFSVFVSGGANGTGIRIYENMNSALTKADVFNLLNVIKRNKIKYCPFDACKSVRQIRGLGKMYLREICSMFSGTLSVKPIFKATEKFVLKTVNDAVEKIGISEQIRYEISFSFDSTATKVSAKVGTVAIPHKKLLMLAHFSSQRNSEQVSGFLNGLWRNDGVFLAFYILSLADKTDLNLVQITENLPSFYVLKKDVAKNVTGGELARKFSNFENIDFKKDSLILRDKRAKAKLKFAENTRNLRLFTKSLNEEFAEDFMKQIETLLIT